MLLQLAAFFYFVATHRKVIVTGALPYRVHLWYLSNNCRASNWKQDKDSTEYNFDTIAFCSAFCSPMALGAFEVAHDMIYLLLPHSIRATGTKYIASYPHSRQAHT